MRIHADVLKAGGRVTFDRQGSTCPAAEVVGRSGSHPRWLTFPDVLFDVQGGGGDATLGRLGKAREGNTLLHVAPTRPSKPPSRRAGRTKQTNQPLIPGPNLTDLIASHHISSPSPPWSTTARNTVQVHPPLAPAPGSSVPPKAVHSAPLARPPHRSPGPLRRTASAEMQRLEAKHRRQHNNTPRHAVSCF